MREAHRRRVSGQAFTPLFRATMWGAAAFAELLGVASGAVSYLVFTDRNVGWGGILLFFSVPTCLMGLASAFVFAWSARYRPSVSAAPTVKALDPEEPDRVETSV